MNWLLVVRLLLQLTVLIVQKRNDAEQQQIGADRVVKNALVQLALSTRVARKIDLDSSKWDADTVDDKLRNYYRENGGGP